MRKERRHSEETKQKIANAHRGKKRIPFSIEWKKNMSVAHKGKKFTEEHRKNLSLSMIGNRRSLGRIHSEESKRKMSEAGKGKHFRKHTEEEKRKQSMALKGRKHTKETRKKMSEAQKGEKGNNWKGGIKPINERIRNSHEYKDWRTAVFERDNYTCQKCKTRNGNGKAVYLNAHHVLAFAGCSEKRFDIENGITLCSDCHKEL